MKESIKKHLDFDVETVWLDVVDSTNLYAKENAAFLKDGSVVIANKQTAGRGRMGRSFFSNGGIYMTFLYKELSAEAVPYLTCFAAVAVAKAVEKTCGAKPKIKWVNDLFLNGKKLCGILAEGVTLGASKEISTVVVGIGLNVEKIDFPEELKDVATSLFGENFSCDKSRLMAEIINNFKNVREELEKKAFVEEYRRLCFVVGKKVSIGKDSNREAVVLGIDDDLSLVVEENGKIEKLSCGEKVGS